MKIIKLEDAPTFPAPPPSGKVSKILIDPVLGSKHIAAGFVVYPKGEKGSFHSHKCEETIFIVHGKAKVSHNGEEKFVEHGDLIFVSPGDVHQMENAGEDELQFLWIYTPPGEEKSIRERVKH